MILSPYDPSWPLEFSALRAVYADVLADLVVAIEHVGCTAVPGLRAKPILDIDLVMPDYASFPGIVAALERLGYTHNGDQGLPQREVFKPRERCVPYTTPRRDWMTHHLYVCPRAGVELYRHIRFRDALRSHPGLRQEYEALKIGIENRAGNDRKNYARIKETACRDFVERALQQEAHPASRSATP